MGKKWWDFYKIHSTMIRTGGFVPTIHKQEAYWDDSQMKECPAKQ